MSMRSSRTVSLLALALLSACAHLPGHAPSLPSNGTAVFARMRAAYEGRWYHTLTFRQTTTIRQANGRDTVQTWFETLRYLPTVGTKLRIDVAPLSGGNASISTWDSTWVIRNGALAATRPAGNPFLPLIESAYMQPAERTAKEVAPLGIDLSKVRAGTWEGAPVWVVGASTASDTTSAQFWVETKNWMVVRMILGGGAPGRPGMDIHLGSMQRCAGGWLATNVAMFVGGARRQLEEYHEWKCDGAVDDKLMDPRATGGKHWAAP